MSPLSSRFDELDSMVWMENVFVPRSHVFTGEALNRNRRHSLVCWLLWHHSYGWLAKAELTLALALALAEVMGLKENPQTIEQLVELTVNVQTTRTCLTAAELDPENPRPADTPCPTSFTWPRQESNTLKVRQRMGEILRGLPGSSLVNAPADTDFADPSDGRRAGRRLRWWRIHRAATGGASATRLGPGVVGAGRTGGGLRASRQRRAGVLAPTIGGLV